MNKRLWKIEATPVTRYRVVIVDEDGGELWDATEDEIVIDREHLTCLLYDTSRSRLDCGEMPTSCQRQARQALWRAIKRIDNGEAPEGLEETIA